jgi:hypothetical protein
MDVPAALISSLSHFVSLPVADVVFIYLYVHHKAIPKNRDKASYPRVWLSSARQFHPIRFLEKRENILDTIWVYPSGRRAHSKDMRGYCSSLPPPHSRTQNRVCSRQ